MSWQYKKNVYACPVCGRYIVTVDRDVGTTPFIIICRATPGCRGRSESACYRVPQELKPEWHWVRLTDEEAARESPGGQQHHKMGGLFLRPIESDPPAKNGPQSEH